MADQRLEDNATNRSTPVPEMPAAVAERVGTAASGILGERRDVTVLFLDVVDFTASIRRLDSEDAYLLIDQAMRLLAEVVYRFEGTVDKYTGDGLMALFGVPISHEDDPERAVRAALAMQAELRPLQQRFQRMYGVRFQTRIGINTGVVIAGEIGSDMHLEYTVIGDTVNLANRLQAAAEPDTIVVSSSTYQPTRPIIAYRALPPLALKGIAEDVQAFTPLAPRAQPGHVRGLPGLTIPLVGRRDSVEQLLEAFDGVRESGCGQLVAISGAAGVGKSRLMSEFVTEVAHQAVFLAQGDCKAYHHSRPFGLMASLLRDILDLSEGDPPESQIDTLRSYLSKLTSRSNEVLPHLVSVLALEYADTEARQRLDRFDSSALQSLAHAALRLILLGETHSGPMIVCLEDLHWVDPASRFFLDSLIESIVDLPMLLILTSRDGADDRELQGVLRSARGCGMSPIELALDALSVDDGNLLVDKLFGRVHGQTTDLRRTVAQRAVGNPFYAEEIIRMLMDRGGLVHGDGGWETTSIALSLVDEIPSTVKGLILARYDQLDAALRRTLLYATVLGSTFMIWQLQHVTGLSEDVLVSELVVLEERQFVIPVESARIPSYTFAHALIHEAIHSTLLRRDRRKLHGDAAIAVEQDTFLTPEERVEGLAYHYARSFEPERAIPHLVAVAKNATRHCATEIATQRYQQALEIAGPGIAPILAAEIKTGLGHALKFMGRYDEAAEILLDAIDSLQREGLDNELSLSTPLLAQARIELADIRSREGLLDEAYANLETGLHALGEEGSQAHSDRWRSVMDRLAWVRFRQGRLEDSFALASSATLDVDLKANQDPLTVASLYNTLGGVFWQWGDRDVATEYVERSLQVYQRAGHLWGEANATTNLGILHYVLGNWAEAADCFIRSETIRRDIGYIPGMAHNLKNLGQLRIAMGDLVQAHQDLEVSRSMSLRQGDEFGVALAELALTQLCVVQGRIDDAREHIQSVLERSDLLQTEDIVQAHWLSGEVKARGGDLRAGLITVEEALHIAQDATLTEAEADCRRVLGALRAQAGEYLEAESLLREALDLSVQLQAPYNQALTQLELGRLYRTQAQEGQSAALDKLLQARTVLNQALHVFQQLGAAIDLESARLLIDDVTASIAAHQDVVAVPTDTFTGTGAAEPSTIPDGEWHSAVILWLDLSTSAGVDVEDIFEALALVIPSLKSIAGEAGATVIQQQSGLLAVFGAPESFEDDAERAIDVALRMTQFMEKQRHQGVLNVQLAGGVGVSLGNVVAGRLGTLSHTEFVVTGNAVDEAYQLADSAPWGSVRVTPAVQTASERRFVFQLPAADDINTTPFAQLVGEREQPLPARGLPGFRSRLIGRDGQLQAMCELANNLERGLGGVIWLEGEPGIGKSRLVREFAAGFEGTDILLLNGRCSPQRSQRAFSLIVDILSGAMDIQPSDTPAEIAEKFNRASEGWPAEAQMALPYIQVLLGVQSDGRAGDRLAEMEPEQLRQQTFVAIRRLFKAAASRCPVVLLLDDLHWIDSISAELLAFVVTMVTSAPVLFICAQRRQGSDAPNDRLVKIQSLIRNQTLQFRLARLTADESHILLSDLLPGVVLPDALRETIIERSEGNPYFLEEFIRMLVEQGYLRQSDGAWSMAPNLDIQRLPVPPSLETLIRSRIDALAPELKHLVQCAAVIGPSFDVDLLQWVSQSPTTRGDLLRLESRLLVARGAERDEWRFTHTLIETVAYAAVLRVRRRALHLRVAERLELRWAGVLEEHAEEMAYHYDQAQSSVRALHFLLVAGERAVAQYANDEAISLLEKARTLEAGAEGIGREMRQRMAAALGDAYRDAGRFADSKMALEMGLALGDKDSIGSATAAGLNRRLGQTLLGQGELEGACRWFDAALQAAQDCLDRESRAEAARALTGKAWIHFLQGQAEQAGELCERSLETARSAGCVNELANAENLLGGVYFRQGAYDEATHHTMRAMVLRQQMGYNWGVASSLSNLGVLAVASGQWHKARSFFERSLHLRQELGDVEGVVLVHNNLGTLDRDQGHLDRARVHFEASLATAAPLEMGFHTANSSIGLAQALLGTGQVEAARTSVIAGMRLAKRIGADEVLAEAYRVQAEIYSQTGEVELARAQAERSAALAAEIGQANLEVAAWRVAASIALQLQDYVMAQDALDRAQQAAGIGVDDIEIGRLAAVAGRLHMRTGEIALAKESLTAAREVFMRLGARIELADIEDALRASTQSRIVTTESSISAGSIQIGGCAPSPSTCLQ